MFIVQRLKRIIIVLLGLVHGQLLLSVNVMTNKHDQLPYSLGEGRPNAHIQFSPSWALIIRGPQTFVDYLCARRRESVRPWSPRPR